MTISQFITGFYPTLLTLLVAMVAYIGKEITPIVVTLLRNKNIRAVAKDLWNLVEEEFRLNPIIGATIQAKQKLFESEIKQKIPGITDIEINTARQAIAGQVNLGKAVVEKAIAEPTANIVIVAPNTIYKTADGTTLASTATSASTSVPQA